MTASEFDGNRRPPTACSSYGRRTNGGDTLRRDAIRTHRRFGEYGVSVLGAASVVAFDELACRPLQRFQVLAVMTAGPLR